MPRRDLDLLREDILAARPEIEKDITASREIIAFRNHLAHGYFLIANVTVWGSIENHLPVLLDEIERLNLS